MEHLRLAQWDILEFSRDKDHVSPDWPAGYWPDTEAPADDAAWEKSVESFHADLKAMQDLVADPKTDLYAKLPWGDGQTVLREAMLVADHNAYHVGADRLGAAGFGGLEVENRPIHQARARSSPLPCPPGEGFRASPR